MHEAPLRVLVVVGSLRRASATRSLLRLTGERLREDGCVVDMLDLLANPLPLYNPDTAEQEPAFIGIRQQVAEADVFVLGTPDYHGSVSSALKNFLDHFWHEFAGKLFVTVVASHEKGLTVTDQLRTVARQCYAWALPYGLAFAEDTDVREGRIVSAKLEARLSILVRDTRVYGALLASQRRRDLAGQDPGFMARHRPR